MQRLEIFVIAGLLAWSGTAPALAGAPVATPSAAPAATASAAPGAATPTPQPDPAVEARAKSWYHMLETGTIDRSQLAPVAVADYSDAKIAQAAVALKQFGDPVTFEQEQTGNSQGSSVYVYLLTFGNGQKLIYVFAFDAQGKVTGLRVSPAQP